MDCLRTNAENTLVSIAESSPRPIKKIVEKQEQQRKLVKTRLKLIEVVDIFQEDTIGKRSTVRTFKNKYLNFSIDTYWSKLKVGFKHTFRSVIINQPCSYGGSYYANAKRFCKRGNCVPLLSPCYVGLRHSLVRGRRSTWYGITEVLRKGNEGRLDSRDRYSWRSF